MFLALRSFRRVHTERHHYNHRNLPAQLGSHLNYANSSDQPRTAKNHRDDCDSPSEKIKDISANLSGGYSICGVKLSQMTLVLMGAEDLTIAMLQDNIMSKVTPELPSPSGILNITCDFKHIIKLFLRTQILLKNFYLRREALTGM